MLTQHQSDGHQQLEVKLQDKQERKQEELQEEKQENKQNPCYCEAHQLEKNSTQSHSNTYSHTSELQISIESQTHSHSSQSHSHTYHHPHPSNKSSKHLNENRFCPYAGKNIKNVNKKGSQSNPTTTTTPHPCKDCDKTGKKFSQFSGLTCLVAEDNEINRRVAQLILSKLGIICVFAQDGQDAFEKAKNEAFNFIFMDIMMPTMDGFECTGLIRFFFFFFFF